MNLIAKWFKDHPNSVLQLRCLNPYSFVTELIDIDDGLPKIFYRGSGTNPQNAFIDLEIRLRPPTVKPPSRY